MSDSHNWAEALKISPQKLSQWSAQAPAGIPLLVYCLEKNLIPANEYFAWACEAYRIPILRSEFFTDAFDLKTLEQSRNTWDPWCFPVETWDDVTIVACTEPPADRPEGHFVYVLADPHAMAEAWSRNAADTMIKPLRQVEKPPPPPEAAPEAEPLPIPDGPIGMDFTKTGTMTFQLNLDSLGLKHSEAKDPHAVDNQTAGEDAGNTLGVMISTGVMPLPEIPQLPELPPAMVQPPTAPTPKLAAKAKPTPTARPAPTAKPVDAGVKRAIEGFKQFYQGVMLFKCEGDQAIPYMWNDGLQVAANGGNPVSLTTPSLFRIVAKTQLPYHGYVVDSPAHRDFFKRFDMPELPVAVTAVPLIQDNRLLAIFVAYGDENAKGPEALACAQLAAESITETMHVTFSTAAA